MSVTLSVQCSSEQCEVSWSWHGDLHSHWDHATTRNTDWRIGESDTSCGLPITKTSNTGNNNYANLNVTGVGNQGRQNPRGPGCPFFWLLSCGLV